MPNRLRIAYYCSGHGYGHATRVSAFASHLLALGASVHIVSSAPAHIFSDSIVRGAHYRYAEIDPVIAQPLAYRIDRSKSVTVLERFLAQKDEKAEHERHWLVETSIDCVITDAAWLASLAAHLAGIPSILCTNFTFDSIFSYLGTQFVDPSSVSSALEPISAEEQTQDTPIASTVLAPLVDQLLDAYRCADLLLLLPGAIPIPSFMTYPLLPSPQWLDGHQRFLTAVAEALDTAQLPAKVSPDSTTRDIVPTPLLVREPSIDVYTNDARAHLLNAIGVPDAMHGHKILVVSFGGQRIVPPRSVSSSASASRSGSPVPPSASHLADGTFSNGERRRSSHTLLPPVLEPSANGSVEPSRVANPHHRHEHTHHHEHIHEPHHASHFVHPLHQYQSPPQKPRPAMHSRISSAQELIAAVEALSALTVHELPPTPNKDPSLSPPVPGRLRQPLRIATPSHIYVPGAPGPVSPPGSGKSLKSFQFGVTQANGEAEEDGPLATLLPDESWIAIVCGAGDSWGGDELPERFFVAPKEVYMPDLTAICDVLMGKLGYSTCAECVDSCTPFIFVPRPLFLEEAGLRIMLQTRGVGLEMTREQYESGDWAKLVQEAYDLGKERKAAKLARGIDVQRQQDLRALATDVLEWIRYRRRPRSA